MNEKQKIESSIYAIIAISKNDIITLESNVEIERIVNGTNGTCFFISPNKFITAHHCLNKAYAENQIYFLINKNGHIITDVQIDFEDSNRDLVVGKIESSVETYCKINNQISIIGGQQFTAYGFSAKDAENLKIKIIKINNEIKIIEHDQLILKKVEYNFIGQFQLKDHLSTDLPPIHLIDCNVLLFDKSLESGFSGGPTFSNNTNELVGFTSQDIFYDNLENPVIAIIPITNE